MSKSKKGMPRMMRLEAMSKEKKQPLVKSKRDIVEKPKGAPPFPPTKEHKGAALHPQHVKARGTKRVKDNQDKALEAPHKKRLKAAKGKK